MIAATVSSKNMNVVQYPFFKNIISLIRLSLSIKNRFINLLKRNTYYNSYKFN